MIYLSKQSKENKSITKECIQLKKFYNAKYKGI